jgi:2-polyprenyl-3-methyl-5-hydroxy-6-metoxy-1,4-benzoquinol methylase
MTDRSADAQRKEFDDHWESDWLPLQSIGPLTDTRYRLLLARLPRGLPAGCRVLDAGCGPGALLERIDRRLPTANLQGIEYSPVAARHAPEGLRERILVGDILAVAPTLPERDFDVIFCSEVLEHVPDPAAVVRALAMLAKPGATLLFSVPAGMAHWSIQDETAGHLRRFETEEFRALLVGAELHIDEILTWGGPIGRLYNALIDRVGPSNAAHAGSAWIGRVAARLAKTALRLDDLWPTKSGFQLIARARSPQSPR